MRIIQNAIDNIEYFLDKLLLLFIFTLIYLILSTRNLQLYDHNTQNAH